MTRRKSDEERLAALIQKQTELNGEIEEVREKVNEKNRKARTSYLINVGGWALAALGCGGTDVEEGELGQEWTRVDSDKLRKVLTTALAEKQSEIVLPETRLIKDAKADMEKVSKQPVSKFMDDAPSGGDAPADTDTGSVLAGEPSAPAGGAHAPTQANQTFPAFRAQRHGADSPIR